MAARRLAKSAIDWTAFAERVPKNQVDVFRMFKAKSDNFVSRVHRYPETLPAIDFAYYRSRLSSPAMVDEFEKTYKGVTVPVPKDPGNLKAAIDAQEKEAMEKTKAEVAEIQGMIANAKALLAKIDSVPPPEEMTHEMYADYFPEQARNPWDKPTFFPHTPDAQPGNDPHEIK